MAERKADEASLEGEAPTVRPLRAPVVIVVGGPDVLELATRRVATQESPAITVEVCALADAASLAASLRPFALVVSQDVYGFDADGFTALVRDVQSELIVLKVARVSSSFLEQAMRPSMRHAFRRFRSETQSGPVRSR